MKFKLIDLLQKLGLFLSLSIFLGCGPSKPSLHLYTWANYFKPELLTQFEEQFGCRVVVDTFESNESMYAKFKAGALGYDLIVPTTYFVQIMNQQGMLQKLNLDAIPNLKYIDTEYAQLFGTLDLNLAVPYLSGYSGLMYRKDKVTNMIPSWGMFGRSSLRGRMTMLNDPREVIGAALKFLGYSLNTTNPAEIAQATETIIRWKPNLAKFESEQYTNGIASAEYLVVQGYSTDSMQVIRENPQVGFFFPQEGTMIGIDQLAIPKQAQAVELAHAFINFFYDPAVSAENMQFIFAVSPNTEAIKLLPPSFKENPLLFPPNELLKRSEWIQDVGENIKLYHEAWNQVKMAR